MPLEDLTEAFFTGMFLVATKPTYYGVVNWYPVGGFLPPIPRPGWDETLEITFL